MTIQVLNGANLGRLGKREPEKYGTTTYAELVELVAAAAAELGVEVHISNIHQREDFRHHSYVSAVAEGVIAGLGVEGYVLALQWMTLRGIR